MVFLVNGSEIVFLKPCTTSESLSEVVFVGDRVIFFVFVAANVHDIADKIWMTLGSTRDC